MDILLQLQSARKHKMLYGCVENVPARTLSHALTELNFAGITLKSLSIFEDALNDDFYIAGFVDKTFCNRKVAFTVSYDDFYRRACGLGEASSIG